MKIINEVANFTPVRVSFWEYDTYGEMTLFAGLATSEFTDPEDYRSSYHVTLDPIHAINGYTAMTPYASECREIP